MAVCSPSFSLDTVVTWRSFTLQATCHRIALIMQAQFSQNSSASINMAVICLSSPLAGRSGHRNSSIKQCSKLAFFFSYFQVIKKEKLVWANVVIKWLCHWVDRKHTVESTKDKVTETVRLLYLITELWKSEQPYIYIACRTEQKLVTMFLLVSVFSPVNHKGLYQGWKQTSVHLIRSYSAHKLDWAEAT